jgi:hypothetical protein
MIFLSWMLCFLSSPLLSFFVLSPSHDPEPFYSFTQYGSSPKFVCFSVT